MGVGRPDVFGVTLARHTIEIEVKCTWSDFVANGQKHHVRSRECCLFRWPRQFYFTAPPELAQRIRPALPAWAGLLTWSDTTWGARACREMMVMSPAPINSAAQRVSTRDMARAARHLSGTCVTMADKLFALTRDAQQKQA